MSSSWRRVNNVASSYDASYGVDTNCYTDTGATDHVTSELDKLSTKDKYMGKEKI
jgi:hypothetical protein